MHSATQNLFILKSDKKLNAIEQNLELKKSGQDPNTLNYLFATSDGESIYYAFEHVPDGVYTQLSNEQPIKPDTVDGVLRCSYCPLNRGLFFGQEK